MERAGNCSPAPPRGCLRVGVPRGPGGPHPPWPQRRPLARSLLTPSLIRPLPRVYLEGARNPEAPGAAAARTCVLWAPAPAAPRPAQTELPAGRRRSSGQSPGGFLLPSPAPRPSASPKSPGSGATSAGTPSLASCPLPGLLCSPSSPSIRLGWAPESAYLWSSCWASRTDRTASCRARSRLASFPHRGHGLSLPGMASSQCSAQGTRGHRMEGTGEARMSKDVRGAGVWGPGVTPSSPAPQQGSPGAKMPSSSSDSSGQDSGVEPLLSVAWLWPEGWSLALRSRQSGPGPWREMAPLRPGAHPHHHVLSWPGRPADPWTPAGVPLALGTWRPAPFLKSRLAEEEAAGVWRTGSAGPGPGLALLTAGWAGQWASVSKPLPAAGAAWHTWWPAPVWLHGGHSCFPRHTGLPRCCARSPCPLRPPAAPCLPARPPKPPRASAPT